ncbi:MAG: glycosyltransferase family 1 protein [Muribaculaceae bacterium]|nr:glycosyltransferase family 1 protein [Muribaculaceae bacterium]
MKILFAGDASNMHNCLARELRRMGHEATVASDGSRWMDTERDINLLRRPGRLGTLRYLWDIQRALPQMTGYDIVEIASPIFLRLRPHRIARVFDYLKANNRHVVLSALATDMVYYDACHDGHTYRYSDYMLDDQPSPYVGSGEYIAQQQDNWKQPFMREHSDHILAGIDGAVACLYEYYVAYKPVLGNRVAYGGIPIDTQALDFRPLEQAPDKVRLFIGIQRDRHVIKGTDKLLAAMKRIHARYPDVTELEVVENLPYAEYTRRMRDSHVILDQLYSYTPGTNALIAMAQGLVAVSGAEPEYYDLIGETENKPIVNVSPLVEGDIDDKLAWLVEHRDQLPQLARASRAFVEKHNAACVVAQRYLDFWSTLL